MKRDSVLWSRVEGHRKAELNNLLFSRAAKAPLDELYRDNPGPLRSVKESKLLSIIKWQVCKLF